jgi:predicted metal-binding membrane protein
MPESARPDLRIASAALALAAGAWALTAQRMAGMDAAPAGDLGRVGWFAVTWLVMMAAMMLPALTPMAVAYGRRAARPGATAVFTAGYLAAWLAAGLVAYALVAAVRSLDPAFLAWDAAGRYVAAGVIAVAGLYQLTASKDGFLRRCRDRGTFLRERWRPGRAGALRMGTEHGGACVGCTWALMSALFALGVMSLTWMAVVAALIAAERLLPRPARLGVALVVLTLATCVALVPDAVPALAAPGSPPMGDMRP